MDWINAVAYGADPSSANDSTAAIQAALDAAAGISGGGTVYMPAGMYMISAPLVITKSGAL